MDAKITKPTFSTNFYIMYYLDKFVLTNTETNCMYELDEETMHKLAKKDVLNQDFIDAGLICEKNTFAWPYIPISKFFYEAIKIQEKELENISYREFWLSYLEASEDVLKEDDANKVLKPFIQTIKLPTHREMQAKLYDALKNRMTSREFYDEPISLQEVADILFISFGKFHDFGDEYLDCERNVAWRRTSPSAGGLNSVQCYVIIHNVEGLEKGVYFYDGQKNELNLIEKGHDQNEMAHYFLGQDFHLNSALNIVMTGNIDITFMKYKHSRGVIMPYMDSGYVGQTVLLVSTSLGLQTWMSAAFCDDYIKRKLHLNDHELPIMFFAIGHGCNEPLGPKIRKELQAIKDERAIISQLAFNSASSEKKVAYSKEESVEEEKEIER